MSNELNKTGAVPKQIFQINNQQATLETDLQTCQLGIANDTEALVWKDKDAVVQSTAIQRRITTRITNANSPYTIQRNDHHLYAATSTGPITLNLPAGIDGREYIIHNTGTHSNLVNIIPYGSELVFDLDDPTSLYDGEVIDIVFETTEGWR